MDAFYIKTLYISLEPDWFNYNLIIFKGKDLSKL